MIAFKVDGEDVAVDVPSDVPLVWVLREELGKTAVKVSCEAALCGACTVFIDGRVRRACVVPVGRVAGREIETIEHLGQGGRLHAVQQAWIDHNVPQCGYCQSGMILSAIALLRGNASPTDEDIDSALSANLCRCGTYPRIRSAVHAAATALRGARPDVVIKRIDQDGDHGQEGDHSQEGDHEAP